MNIQEITPGQTYPDDGQVRVTTPGTGDARNVFRGQRHVGQTRGITCEFGCGVFYRAELPHNHTFDHPVAPSVDGPLVCSVDPMTRHNAYRTMEEAALALAEQS